MRLVRPGNIPSRQQKPVQTGRQTASQRYGIKTMAHLQRSGRIQSVSFHIVNVEGEEIAACDPVVELPSGEDILFRQAELPVEMAAFPDSEPRCAPGKIAVLESRDKTAQKGNNRMNLFPAEPFRRSFLHGVGEIELHRVGHIRTDDSRFSGPMQQDVSGRRGQMLLSQSFEFPFRNRIGKIETLRQSPDLRIHSADLDHQRSALAEMIPLSSDLERSAGAECRDPVPGRIDQTRRLDPFDSGNIGGIKRRDMPVLAIRIHHPGVEEQFDTGLLQHLKEHILQTLVQDSFGAPGRSQFRLRDSPVDLLPQRGAGSRHPFCDHSGSAHSARSISLFQKQDLCSRPGRTERGGTPGDSAPRDHHSGERAFPTGLNGIHIEKPLVFCSGHIIRYFSGKNLDFFGKQS